MIIIGYGIIAILFASLLDKNNAIKVYLLSIGCTVTGVFLRYLMEYGEYSNAINFTQENIVVYLGIIPVICTLIYWIICKFEKVEIK